MCCLQGPAPEEWIAAFASVREAALADEARSHTIDGNTGNALVPFDNLLSSEVWYHLMGAAHLNTFKLQYYSSSATIPEELPATGTAAGITEDKTNKLKGSTEAAVSPLVTASCFFIRGSFFNHACEPNVDIFPRA